MIHRFRSCSNDTLFFGAGLSKPDIRRQPASFRQIMPVWLSTSRNRFEIICSPVLNLHNAETGIVSAGKHVEIEVWARLKRPEERIACV